MNQERENQEPRAINQERIWPKWLDFMVIRRGGKGWEVPDLKKFKEEGLDEKSRVEPLVLSEPGRQ